MVLFNYATRELTAKIVYYGPGLCGKTTNLQHIHHNLPDSVKGKMLSLATKTDRTLFFDFLPLDLGEIRGMKTRVQLYTVPGQVFYNETRKLVLKGADGIVFVADSQEQMRGANVESFRNLEENLKAHGLELAAMPHVIQFNKRDLPKLSSIEQMNAEINRYNAPFYESVATTGIGVQDALKAITKLVLLHLTKKYDPQLAARSAARSAVAPAAPASAPPRPVSTPAAAASSRLRPADATRTIPLSAASEPMAALSSSAPFPWSPAEPAREVHGPVPVFAEQEVDSLVDEVQEAGRRPVGTTAPAGLVQLPRPEDRAGGETRTDDAVLLTEAAKDEDLFRDPNLEITRLAAGDARAIVVPVELGRGNDVRRFRLSVILKLDPLD
jgi:hypothetical protein